MSLFVLAAEPSGDLHGAELIKHLLILNPSLKIYAVAGPEMRKLGIEVIEPMESFCVMGFLDVVASLPRLVSLFYQIKRKVLSINPAKVITIDYPGFNLRLQRALAKSGYSGKQIHYIAPSVWAWGKSRIRLMEKSLDELLCILPFEPACFAQTTLPATYVGHPLVHQIGNVRPNRENLIALFPGSRKKEIDRNLPLQLDAARTLKQIDPSVEIAISASSPEHSSLFSSFAPEAAIYPKEKRYELMRKARLAIAKSGTVTLELALHQTPTIVEYAISPVDQFLATRLFRINLPYFSLPNILLGREVFPELFGSYLTQESLFQTTHALWTSEDKRNKMIQHCAQLKELMGSANGSERAAIHILNSRTFSPPAKQGA